MKSNMADIIEEIEEEVMRNYRMFKNFDIVTDPSDHHYLKSSKPKHNFKPESCTVKQITREWSILEKSLPDSIFVRVYEDRMDLMRAAIIGSEGTPYYNGLFFFDIFFPRNYPSSPPKVHFHSHGERLNPNLYKDGKVCLSLLNTWSGSKRESWIPGESTMLQVLVSLQALVLNARPYFNEPGFEIWPSRMFRPEKNSLEYNNDAFGLSCFAMELTLKNPPKHFEDFVQGHFRVNAETILMRCEEYKRNGVYVSDVTEVLIHAFVANGSYNCRRFRYLLEEEERKSSGEKQGGSQVKKRFKEGSVQSEIDESTTHEKKEERKSRDGFLRWIWKKLLKMLELD